MGVEHALPQAPQLPRSVCSSAHAPPQAVSPALHVKEQAGPPSPAATHVATALAGAAQALHEAPQDATLVSLTHAPPHAWCAAAHAKAHAPPSHAGAAFATVVVQAFPQAPQFATSLGTHAPAHRS
jgi:hypothetical protein